MLCCAYLLHHPNNNVDVRCGAGAVVVFYCFKSNHRIFQLGASTKRKTKTKQKQHSQTRIQKKDLIIFRTFTLANKNQNETIPIHNMTSKKKI